MMNRIPMSFLGLAALICLGAPDARAATFKETPLGSVAAVDRTFVAVLADCQGRTAIKRLTSGKYECAVIAAHGRPTDSLVRATNVNFKVDSSCTINAASTTNGYILTFTMVGGGGGGADPLSCLGDAFRRTQLPNTSLSSFVYIVR